MQAPHFYPLQEPLRHHWIEGNLPSTSRCEQCGKNCFTDITLSGFRCGWCGITVRTLLFYHTHTHTLLFPSTSPSHFMWCTSMSLLTFLSLCSNFWGIWKLREFVTSYILLLFRSIPLVVMPMNWYRKTKTATSEHSGTWCYHPMLSLVHYPLQSSRMSLTALTMCLTVSYSYAIYNISICLGTTVKHC